MLPRPAVAPAVRVCCCQHSTNVHWIPTLEHVGRMCGLRARAPPAMATAARKSPGCVEIADRRAGMHAHTAEHVCCGDSTIVDDHNRTAHQVCAHWISCHRARAQSLWHAVVRRVMIALAECPRLAALSVHTCWCHSRRSAQTLYQQLQSIGKSCRPSFSTLLKHVLRHSLRCGR